MTQHTDMTRAMDDAMRTDLACWLAWCPPRPPGRKMVKGQPREQAAVEALEAVGVPAWAPITLKAKSRGKKRVPEVLEEVLAPGLVFIWADPEMYYRAQDARVIGSTLHLLRSQDRRQLDAWIADVEGERQDVLRKRDRGEVTPHEAGSKLRLTRGPLRDTVIEFVRMVTSSSGLPEFVAYAEAFGRRVEVRVDPLDVRAEK